MELTEKIAYIKGFAEGLNLDENKDEVKVLNRILDFLNDMAEEVQELGELYDEAADMIEEIDEELCDLEDALIESSEDDDEDDDSCDCDDCSDEENPIYEVTCPNCNNKFCVEEDELLQGEMECPECQTTLEFDFSDVFDDDGHAEDCGCGCHCDENYGEDDLMS